MFKKIHEWLIQFYFWGMLISLFFPIFLSIVVMIGASHLLIYVLVYVNTPPDNLF
jgi:hypothetical protein